MDNNQLIQRQQNIQVTLQQQSKQLIFMFYGLTTIILVTAILCIVSSAQLNRDYFFQPIQVMQIIDASAILVFVVLSLIFFLKINTNTTKFMITGYLIFIALMIAFSLAGVSMIISIPYQYCGTFINHDGIYDGAFIIGAFYTSTYYLSCYGLQDLNTDQTTTITAYAKRVLITDCGANNYSCQDFSSLVVKSWSDEFGTQIAACVLATICSFLYVIVIIKIRIRIRNIQQNIAQNLAILTAAQSNQNLAVNQYYYDPINQVQPQYPQNFAQNPIVYQQPQQFQGQYQPINPGYPPAPQNQYMYQQQQQQQQPYI